MKKITESMFLLYKADVKYDRQKLLNKYEMNDSNLAQKHSQKNNNSNKENLLTDWRKRRTLWSNRISTRMSRVLKRPKPGQKQWLLLRSACAIGGANL